MGWCQKVTPNLDDKTLVCYDANGKAMKDWCGWCLAVAQQAFGITKRQYPSAIKAWEGNTTKHCDLNFPTHVDFPIFWRGGEYGHVAIARYDGHNITIWSSPYAHKPYFDVFKGWVNKDTNECDAINQITTKYGLKEFIGWTETLTGTRLIEWIDDPVLPKPPEPEIIPEPEPEPTPEEKPVENTEPTDKEPVDNSTDGILARMLKRLIEWIKSFL